MSWGPSRYLRSRSVPFATIVILFIVGILAPPTSAIIVDGATITGYVMEPGGSPIEGVLVVVEGVDGMNATTAVDGSYSLVVAPDETGYTLRFTHLEYRVREEPTGPLGSNDWAEVNASLSPKLPYAILKVRILPWDIPGSNYGLRQDKVEVASAPGTPDFSFTEKDQEVEVTVHAPGTYMVTGSRPGYYDLTLEVTVGKGETRVVDIDLSDRKKPTYGEVNGVVSYDGFAMPNVQVVAEPEDGDRTWSAITNGTGGYTLQLPSGNYTIYVDAKGYAKISEGVAVEVGGSYPVDLPLSIAQGTGDETMSVVGWLVLGVTLAVLVFIAGWGITLQRRAAAEARAERAEIDTLRCPSCGAEAPPDANSCPGCETAFPWRSFRCPECGAVMELDAKKCSECGNQTFDLHRG
jgi:ribosomal protein L40E